MLKEVYGGVWSGIQQIGDVRCSGNEFNELDLIVGETENACPVCGSNNLQEVDDEDWGEWEDDRV